MIAWMLLVGCPAPMETDTDPVVGTDVDTDTDTMLVSGLSERPENRGCLAWTGALPERLSQTGCVAREDPSRAGPMMVPYSVSSPLWSDDADKERFLSLPDGTSITLSADGDFEFPTGAVLGKWFAVDGVLIEVRLFGKTDSGWSGGSWRWDADLGDGVLEASGATVPRPDGGTWDIPATWQCHTAAAGGSLGLEVAQLGQPLVYPGGVEAGQLHTLRHIGMIDGDVPSVPLLPDPFDDAHPVDARARSYLHSNCAACHRPGGGTPYAMDLRFPTPLADAEICGEDSRTSFGLSDMQRLAPGDVEHSMIHRRMATAGFRMPPLGTNQIDLAATDLVAAWIASLEGCP